VKTDRKHAKVIKTGNPRLALLNRHYSESNSKFEFETHCPLCPVPMGYVVNFGKPRYVSAEVLKATDGDPRHLERSRPRLPEPTIVSGRPN
jgi:hypothetical protein